VGPPLCQPTAEVSSHTAPIAEEAADVEVAGAEVEVVPEVALPSTRISASSKVSTSSRSRTLQVETSRLPLKRVFSIRFRPISRSFRDRNLSRSAR
jgi:hypothetical protein